MPHLKQAKLVFVCDFNLVRSVVCEHVLRRRLEDGAPHLLGQISVSSAGLPVMELKELLRQHKIRVIERPFGKKVPGFVSEIMFKDEGVDLSSSRSKPLTREVVMESDLIITVTRPSKEEILHLRPWSEGKVFTIDEVGIKRSDTDLSLDNEQPYGLVYIRHGTFRPEDEEGSVEFPYQMGVSRVRELTAALSEAFEGILDALLNSAKGFSSAR